MIEIPLHDQLAVSIDVHVPRWMIALPGDEDVSTSPVFAHLLKMLPLKVTVSQWRAQLAAAVLESAPDVPEWVGVEHHEVRHLAGLPRSFSRPSKRAALIVAA